MAAGSQNAWDLMRGIYTAWGRAGVDPDTRFNRDITLADLVALYKEEGPLRRMDEIIRMLNPPTQRTGVPHLDVIRWFEGHWEQGGDQGRLTLVFNDPTHQGAFHADDPRFTVSGHVYDCTFLPFDRPMGKTGA